MASTVLNYSTKAIAGLEEVRADYELGVACRQRAYVYKQLGQLECAASDLRKAQNCFEAVGLTFQQAEVA